MSSARKLFLSEKILLEDAILNGGVLVDGNGRILKLFSKENARIYLEENGDTEIDDFGKLVLMPGLIDTHVHVNEPGRTEWEGFETATKAAAAGGITTIVDMPLNSIPPTTTLENLREKVRAAQGKTYVDVAFWGGVVPGNKDDLLGMVEAGVVGFKCFLTPSGVDEFHHVEMKDVEKALEVLESTNTVLAFHAELEEHLSPEGNPTVYETFLKTRPSSMEENAIKKVIDMSRKFNVRTHIVHLSAATALPLIEEAKADGIQLTIETCHHYLTLSSNAVPEKATEYKCCPPIRNTKNKEMLWEALKDNVIDMVVSDHSPSTADLKLLNTTTNCGNFVKAWGGIASVQFGRKKIVEDNLITIFCRQFSISGLSLFWTEANRRGFTIFDINRYMTQAPAKLVGLHKRKGYIKEGFDADFVIWDPEATVIIEKAMIQHKNKITPYLGKEFRGEVASTILRGEIVYENKKQFGDPKGILIINTKLF